MSVYDFRSGLRQYRAMQMDYGIYAAKLRQWPDRNGMARVSFVSPVMGCNFQVLSTRGHKDLVSLVKQARYFSAQVVVWLFLGNGCDLDIGRVGTV